jgi:hypothetical protein
VSSQAGSRQRTPGQVFSYSLVQYLDGVTDTRRYITHLLTPENGRGGRRVKSKALHDDHVFLVRVELVGEIGYIGVSDAPNLSRAVSLFLVTHTPHSHLTPVTLGNSSLLRFEGILKKTHPPSYIGSKGKEEILLCLSFAAPH